MQQSTFFGRPRWQLVLAVVFISQLMNAVGFSMVFPFLPLYVQDLGSTTGMSVELMAGLVISAQGFTMMLASPVWGAVADRYGRKLMVMRATFGGSVLLAVMGIVTSGEQLIFLRAIQGFVTGTVAANAALVAAATPRDKIGFAMGTLQVGLWGGVALGPLVGGFLADLYGFSTPFFITGTLLFLSGVLIYFGVEEEFTPQDANDTRESPGLLAQITHVISAENVSMVYLMRFLSGVGRMMIIPIAPLFVVSLLPTDAANSSIFAGSVMAVSSATSTISGVYLGRLGDKIGHRTVLIGSAIAIIVFYIPQMFVTNVWQLLGLQALAGLAVGGIISAPAALLAHYTDPGEEGAVYGLDNSIVAGARAAAPLVGAGVALWFGLRGTFGATALFFVVVTLIAWVFLPRRATSEQPALQATAAGD